VAKPTLRSNNNSHRLRYLRNITTTTTTTTNNNTNNTMGLSLLAPRAPVLFNCLYRISVVVCEV
jgi:hypothetical protein